jgi:hypothetical protein
VGLADQHWRNGFATPEDRKSLPVGEKSTTTEPPSRCIRGWGAENKVNEGFHHRRIDVIVHPVRQMDIVVEQNSLGFLAGDQRWSIHLGGILKIGRICSDTWTVYHYNGTVINIPVSAITQDQVDHLVAARQRGIEALIEHSKKAGETESRPEQ